MDRLRRSLRDSFRKKKDHVPECSKPHQWQSDEAAVRAGTCNFPVKYLGCVEVFDSRGMQVCEEALRLLRNSRRRPVKGVLYVTGDGLRVVDEDTKGLIVDQTIEKVSFCAPDRNHEKGFSYICRDGTTRRWMCHGFLAVKDSGERLSHAVGCAFAACLERKQKRDKECGVSMTFDPNGSAFTRTGSFRQTSLTERMQDPQECKPFDPPPPKSITNPFAIERPHATPMMLERQGSFRGFNHLQQASPFKRQLSLRVNDLPSNLERQQKSLGSRSSEKREESPANLNGLSLQPAPVPGPASPQLPPRIPRNRLHSLPNTAVNMSPIPESSPTGDRQPDTIRAMCQQVTEGLSMLCSTDDPFTPSHVTPPNTRSVGPSVGMNNHVAVESFEPIPEQNPWKPAKEGASRAEAWLASNVPSHISVSKSSSNPLDLFGVSRTNGQPSPHSPSMVTAPPRRAPHLSHLRSQSLGASADPHVSRAHPVQSPPSVAMARYSGAPVTFQTQSPSQRPEDPFDAGWVNLPPTNPFQQNSVKAFEVHL